MSRLKQYMFMSEFIEIAGLTSENVWCLTVGHNSTLVRL